MIRLTCEGFDLLMTDFNPQDAYDRSILTKATELIMRRQKSVEKDEQNEESVFAAQEQT